MRSNSRTAVTIVLLAGWATMASAEDGDLRKDISELKQIQASIQKDLQEIKQLLKSAPAVAAAARAQAPLPPSMDASGILVKGDPKAPITIVEFTDLQCPFCGRYAQNTLSQIDNEYIKTGKVRYVVKDFPLESIHSHAMRAAEANHCAAEQNRAWEMHDRLFANQKKLTRDDLIGHAGAIGLDMEKFKVCLDSGRYEAEVRKEIALGQASGVNGTPSFLLGATDGSKPGLMKPKRMLNGALDFSVFKSVIDDMAANQARKE